MIHPTHRALLMLACLACPGSLMAEVSDKELVAVLFWQVGSTTAFLCLCTARFRPWLGAICFIPAAIWFVGLFLSIHAPDIGPYLRLECGNSYYLQAYAAFSLAMAGLITGYLWHKRKPI